MAELDKNGEEKNRIVGGTLYLVATPIGNLSDLSERALKTLAEVDFIAAEDTRNSQRLLSHFGIRKELVSYFEHNKRQKGDYILSRLLGGESCALITDAGMPAVSDPGEDLVRLCAEGGVPVTAVPGCCAAVTALALSGISTARFAFEGFLPVGGSERRERLSAIAKEERTLILYEAPHRLRETLADLYATLGERSIALCRELTKLNEEIFRTRLSAAIETYREKEPRGEYVLVLSGYDKTADEEARLAAVSPVEQVRTYEAEGLSRMDAIKKVARERGVAKNEIYKLMLEAEE